MIVFVLLFWRLQENPNEEKKRLSFGNPLRKLKPDLKLSPSSQATPTESKPPTEFVLFVYLYYYYYYLLKQNTRKTMSSPIWLHEAMEKKAAEELLPSTLVDGQFFFRLRPGHVDNFVLCVVYKQHPTHHLVNNKTIKQNCAKKQKNNVFFLFLSCLFTHIFCLCLF